jgi:hypothetical protein
VRRAEEGAPAGATVIAAVVGAVVVTVSRDASGSAGRPRLDDEALPRTLRFSRGRRRSGDTGAARLTTG